MKYSCWLLILVFTGCGISVTSTDSTVVEGDKSTKDKENIAQLVVQAVWHGSLKSDIRSEFPQISSQEIEGNLGIKWETMKFQPLTGENKSQRDVVRITCLYRSKEKAVAGKIASICAGRVKNELAKQI